MYTFLEYTLYTMTMDHLILFKSFSRFFVRGGEGERTGEKERSERGEKNSPPPWVLLFLFNLLALLTESLEGKISIVLYSKLKKSLGSTEDGHCFVQVVASTS